MDAPTYEEYAQRVHPRSKLERELDAGKSVDVHLSEIADTLKNWEAVAPFLGLDDTQIEDIASTNRRAILKRRDALKAWKKKFSFRATYGALLKVCVERGETDCAMKIIELLGTSPNGVGASSASTSPGHPQTGNYPPQGRGQQMPPASGARAPQNSKQDFSEDFGPDELYAWLRSHQVPEPDCAKIKANEIGGIAFKLITEDEGWEDYKITKLAITIIKKRIKNLLESGAGSNGSAEGGNVAAATPQTTQQATLPPSPQQEPGILNEIKGSLVERSSVDSDGGGGIGRGGTSGSGLTTGPASLCIVMADGGSDSESAKNAVPDQLSILQELMDISQELRVLALVLKISNFSDIETNFPSNVAKRREKMVESWFQKGRPSWRELCEALRNPLVGRNDIANQIQRKYL